MTTTARVVLDLDHPRPNTPFIKIDGVDFTMLEAHLLPPLKSHRMLSYSRRLDVLVTKDTLTDEDQAELEGLPEKMCRLVLQAPDEVHAKLNDEQRMAIVSSFLRPEKG